MHLEFVLYLIWACYLLVWIFISCMPFYKLAISAPLIFSVSGKKIERMQLAKKILRDVIIKTGRLHWRDYRVTPLAVVFMRMVSNHLGPWCNIEMPHYQYKDPRLGDKTVVRSGPWYVKTSITHVTGMTDSSSVKTMVVWHIFSWLHCRNKVALICLIWWHHRPLLARVSIMRLSAR